MPDFLEKFDNSGDVIGIEFSDLCPFTRGYIEALFFTEHSPGWAMSEWHDSDNEHSDGQLPDDAGFSDLNADTLSQIHSDCSAFKRAAASLLSRAYSRDYDREQAGRDFWFTRNGHGVGFWDRDELTADDLGQQLSTIAKSFGEVWASFDGPDESSPTGYGFVNLS